MGRRDDDDIRPERQQLVNVPARPPAVGVDECDRTFGDRIGRADQLVGWAEGRGSFTPDQAAADDPHSQPSASAHEYSLDEAPTNSKSNGSSIAPAAAIACLVSAGLRAYT